jgi:hypothetical protein
MTEVIAIVGSSRKAGNTEILTGILLAENFAWLIERLDKGVR